MNYTLFADYFQIVLQDEAAGSDLSDAWTDDNIDHLIAVAPGVVGVGTVRNANVPVEVTIEEKAPTDDLNEWDMINECGLQLTTDTLVVLGNEYFPNADRIKIKPGNYGVRVYYKNLEKLSRDGLWGEDSYKITLWPCEEIPELRFIKSRNEGDEGEVANA